MNRGEVEELVQTTVRKMNCGPEACLTNPRVLSFFNIMKDSFLRCVKTVTTAADPKTSADTAAAYQSIASWPPERVAEEVELILKRYPSVKDSYTYAAVYIVEQTYKKNSGQMKLKLPSFQSFVHTFYVAMVQSEPMQQGTYNNLQFFEKEMLCCQAFCNALYNSIRTEPVVKEQPSVIVERSAIAVGGGGGAAKASFSKAGAAGASMVSKVSQVASASRFSKRALSPQDSVSQLRPGVAAAPPGRGQENVQGLLTDEFLKNHRLRVGSKEGSGGDKSRAGDAAASIRKAASRKGSVRVVDIVEHPQKLAAAKKDDSTTSSSSRDDKSSFAFTPYSRVDPTAVRHEDRETSRSRYSTSRRDREDGEHHDRHQDDSYYERRHGSREDRTRRDRDDEDRRPGYRRDDNDLPVSRHNPNRRH